MKSQQIPINIDTPPSPDIEITCRSCGYEIAGRFEEQRGDWRARRLPVKLAAGIDEQNAGRRIDCYDERLSTFSLHLAFDSDKTVFKNQLCLNILALF
jgi:hypothetical protein